MVTLKDLHEDWIQARTALKRQLKLLETEQIFRGSELSEDVRKAIAVRLKNAVAEYDALLKEYPNA